MQIFPLTPLVVVHAFLIRFNELYLLSDSSILGLAGADTTVVDCTFASDLVSVGFAINGFCSGLDDALSDIKDDILRGPANIFFPAHEYL